MFFKSSRLNGERFLPPNPRESSPFEQENVDLGGSMPDNFEPIVVDAERTSQSLYRPQIGRS